MAILHNTQTKGYAIFLNLTYNIFVLNNTYKAVYGNL